MLNNLVKESVRKLKPYEVKEYKKAIKLDGDATALRKEIGRQVRVAPQQVLMGDGSDGLISMVVAAFVEEGEKIVTSTSTCGMYKITTEAAGGIVVEVPLGKDFAFDYYSFIRTVKQEGPKVVFLTNPNNPTGGIIPREQMIRIVEHANSVVVVDEAYYEFYGGSMVDLVNFYPNLVVLRTLSKAFGLAGARVGYAIGGREVIGILNKVKPPYNISSLRQAVAKV